MRMDQISRENQRSVIMQSVDTNSHGQASNLSLIHLHKLKKQAPNEYAEEPYGNYGRQLYNSTQDAASPKKRYSQ